MAALLLGIPGNGTSSTNLIQYVPQLAFHWQYWGLYFQDDFRITSRLTLNLGLRYDIETGPKERYNQMNRGFAFNTQSPLASNPQVKNANPADCLACANLSGGLLFAGQNGQPSSAFQTQWANVQPRIGGAYKVASRTVVRAGFGRFFLPEAAYGGSAGFASNTPFVATQGGGINAFIPTATLSNPYPQGLIPPSGASLGLLTFAGQSVTFNNPDRKIPYVNSYSAGVQHQFPWSVVLDVSYVGSRTYHINTNDNQAGGARNINVPTVAQLQQANQNASFFSQSVPNPFAGLLPGTNLNSATIPRQQLLLPYPQFTAVFEGSESVGRLWYDSLQINLEKRLSHGLVLDGAYTWSKQIEALTFLNNQDPRPAKTLAATDRPQRFVLSAVYQFPFGRGRRFAHGVGRGWEAVIGGWEYNILGVVQSGTPLNLPGSFNLLSDPSISNANHNQYFNTCELLTDGTTRMPNAAHNGFVSGCGNPAWLQLTGFVLRSTPLRSPHIRNPWAPSFDMSMVKRFHIVERVSADFRFEAFNVFNTVIQNQPNTDPNSTQFGSISLGQSNFPRQVQLGFKLNF